MNCGALMEFQAGNKPKFCSSCGANTSTGKVAPVKKVVAKPVVEQVNLEDEDANVRPPRPLRRGGRPGRRRAPRRRSRP